MESNQSSITLGIRNNKKEVEEHPVFAPKFDADGLIPAMAMDAITKGRENFFIVSRYWFMLIEGLSWFAFYDRKWVFGKLIH